jgi:hypothetical protein
MTDRSKFPMIFYTEEQLNAYFLERLKQLCLEYDSKAGRWPDHELEGFALYYFALHPEYDPSDEYHKVDPDNVDEGEEYIKELGFDDEVKDDDTGILVDSVEITADESGTIINMEISSPYPDWRIMNDRQI